MYGMLTHNLCRCQSALYLHRMNVGVDVCCSRLQGEVSHALQLVAAKGCTLQAEICLLLLRQLFEAACMCNVPVFQFIVCPVEYPAWYALKAHTPICECVGPP